MTYIFSFKSAVENQTIAVATANGLGHGLKGQEQALFAVCDNTETLIPEFTGHVLQSGGQTVFPPDILTNPDDINKNWISDANLGMTLVPQVLIGLQPPFSRVDLLLELVSRDRVRNNGQMDALRYLQNAKLRQ